MDEVAPGVGADLELRARSRACASSARLNRPTPSGSSNSQVPSAAPSTIRRSRASWALLGQVDEARDHLDLAARSGERLGVDRQPLQLGVGEAQPEHRPRTGSRCARSRAPDALRRRISAPSSRMQRIFGSWVSKPRWIWATPGRGCATPRLLLDDVSPASNTAIPTGMVSISVAVALALQDLRRDVRTGPRG